MTIVRALAAVALAAGVILASAPAATAESFDLKDLLHTARADLEAAQVNAESHSDLIASQCYAGIIIYLDAHPAENLHVGEVVGVASAFQIARNAVKFAQVAAAEGMIPPELILACGPQALDVQNDLGKGVGFGFLGLHF